MIYEVRVGTSKRDVRMKKTHETDASLCKQTHGESDAMSDSLIGDYT